MHTRDVQKKRIRLQSASVFFVFTFCLLSTNFLYAQEDTEMTCPANSHYGDGQCLCNGGYVSVDGDSCVAESQLCAAFGPSHLVGNDCVCNDGYGVVDGSQKCVSLSAACAKFDAVRNDSIGDCSCKSGYHEDESAGKCMPDGPSPQEIAKQKAAAAEAEAQKQKFAAEAQALQEATKKQAELEAQKKQAENDAWREAETKRILEEKAASDAIKQKAAEQTTAEQKTTTSPSDDTATVQTYTQGQDIYNEVETISLTPMPASDGNVQEIETISLVRKPLEKVIETLPPEEKIHIDDQIKVIDSFTDNGEVTLPQGDIFKPMKDEYVATEQKKAMQNRQQEVQKAEQEAKVKEGYDAEKFKNDLAREQELKVQIIELEKQIGFNHLRILETTKVLKYDTMGADYKKNFQNKPIENAFDDTAEGVAFNGLTANVNAMTTQVRELKETLKSTYPQGRKEKVLDVPAMPTQAQQRKKINENIFLLFEKNKK